MERATLDIYLNKLLQPDLINDYCPNGLQVEGTGTIKKIITGVTATQALIDQAIDKKADAVLVHHGYFWKNESPTITGIKFQRIRKLIDNNINLYAYHLPLDVHGTLGNNAQLASLLGISIKGSIESAKPLGVVMHGEFEELKTATEVNELISVKLQRQPVVISPQSNKPIKSIAWCTGGGQNYIELAAQYGIDAFITGEASEQTTHIAREMNIHFFAAGHHATERYGIKALGEYLAKNYQLDVEFIDIDNPI